MRRSSYVIAHQYFCWMSQRLASTATTAEAVMKCILEMAKKKNSVVIAIVYHPPAKLGDNIAFRRFDASITRKMCIFWAF